MKTVKTKIVLLSILSLLALPALAQTNGVSTNAPTATSNAASNSITAAVGTAYTWLTSFNPTNTWVGAHGYVQTGAAYQNQLQFADALEAGFNVWSPATNSGVTISDNLLTAGVAGTIVNDSIDFAWRYDIHDVQLQFGAGPGYDKLNEKVFADIMGEIQKHTTPNTHAYIRLDLPFEGKKSALELIAGIGGEF
jgi:hypothetical protein